MRPTKSKWSGIGVVYQELVLLIFNFSSIQIFIVKNMYVCMYVI